LASWGESFGVTGKAQNVNGALGWMSGRNNKFKINMVRIIVSLFLVLVQWLQSSNDINFSKYLTYGLLYFFTFFGDLAVTGRLNPKDFNLKSFLVPAKFIPFMIFDAFILFAIFIAFFDMVTSWGFVLDPTLKTLWSAIIGFVLQQFHANTMKEGFIYNRDDFKLEVAYIIKVALFIVLAVGSCLQYALVYNDYAASIQRRNCAKAWDNNIGNDVCSVLTDSSQQGLWTSCIAFCGKYTGEPLCVQINGAVSNSTCTFPAKNIGKEIGAAVVLIVLAYLVFGGMIPGNKWSLSGLFNAESDVKQGGTLLEQAAHKVHHKTHHKKSHHASSD